MDPPSPSKIPAGAAPPTSKIPAKPGPAAAAPAQPGGPPAAPGQATPATPAPPGQPATGTATPAPPGQPVTGTAAPATPGQPAATTPGQPPPAAPVPPAPPPPPVDDGIRVEISADVMEAVIIVPAGVSIPASTALDRMMKANVNTGVIEPALQEIAVASDEERRIVVARGVAAVLQKDARIEVLVDFKLRVTEDDQHHVNFRDQGRFHEVEAGAVLAKLIPKEVGTPGKTVLGKVLAVGAPRDADLGTVAGEGCRIDPAGDGRVIAERTGLIVRRRDGHLDIFPKVDINGDLDMHWGNLQTKLPVNIKGDIIGGFSVKSGGDVDVKGVIEDARISVKGNLTCGGILAGAHRVKAHGDVSTKHITARTIKCRNLTVSSDLRGVTVFAVGSVTAGLVISSTIQCGGSMVCEELGHPAELGGLVTVGLNPLAVALYKLAERERTSLSAEVTELKLKIKKLAVWTKKEGDAGKRQELARDLKKALATFEDSERRLGECDKVLNNSTLRLGNNLDATLTVNQKLHPGVEIHIGADAKLVVTKPMHGKTVFVLKEGKIVWENPVV